MQTAAEGKGEEGWRGSRARLSKARGKGLRGKRWSAAEGCCGKSRVQVCGGRAEVGWLRAHPSLRRPLLEAVALRVDVHVVTAVLVVVDLLAAVGHVLHKQKQTSQTAANRVRWCRARAAVTVPCAAVRMHSPPMPVRRLRLRAARRVGSSLHTRRIQASHSNTANE